MDVRLAPIEEREYDDFFALMEVYQRELDPFDPAADDPWDSERHRAAVLDDMDGRELWWIEADGTRAGFVMVRLVDDWPQEERQIASIAEFYVLPEHRRRGVGTAAIHAVLADHRERGTYEVEASILPGNEAARAFWAALGFEVRSIITARRP